MKQRSSWISTLASVRSAPFALVLSLGLAAACAGSPPSGGGSGGSGSGGAASGSGGRGSGGNGSSQSGGTTGNASGGAVGSGGSTSSGGATGSGGKVGSGGGTASGGANGSGGATGSGGASASGGASGAAGAMASGGRAGSSASGGSAGGSGGGNSGGSPGGACAGKYKFCDDFESGTAGGIPPGWTALKSYGPAEGVGLANDQAHSGSMSVKTSTMSTGAQRIQVSLGSLGATAAKHWGRLYYKVQTPAPLGANNAYYHVTFAALQGTTENRVVDTVEDPNGKIQYIFNLPDDSCCTGSSYDWSHDGKWHCAEWHVDVSAKSYQFFIDGKEVTQIGFTGNANAKMSNYTALAVGAIFYVTPTGPWTSWIDDVAIDDNQIGCN